MKNATQQGNDVSETTNDSTKDQPTKLPSIGSDNQYRFILAIIEKPKSTKELLAICAVTNAADIAFKLRKRGWVISTQKTIKKSRYGKKVEAYDWKLETPIETAKAALKAFNVKNQKMD